MRTYYCIAQGTLLNVIWTACKGGEFGGEWIHVYVWLSLFTVHLKLSQQCQLVVFQYKIKVKK